jgi:hypothetical protein
MWKGEGGKATEVETKTRQGHIESNKQRAGKAKRRKDKHRDRRNLKRREILDRGQQRQQILFPERILLTRRMLFAYPICSQMLLPADLILMLLFPTRGYVEWLTRIKIESVNSQ